MVEVELSVRAFEDIDEIALYWSGFSEKTARFYINKIYATIELLKSFPNLGKISPELDILMSGKFYRGPTGYFTTSFPNTKFRSLPFIIAQRHSILKNCALIEWGFFHRR